MSLSDLPSPLLLNVTDALTSSTIVVLKTVVLKRVAILTMLSILILSAESFANVPARDSSGTSTHPSASASVVFLETGRMRFGDDPDWARPAFDDAGWEERILALAPDSTGIYWIRTSLSLDASARTHRPGAVLLGALASADVYWDGVHIGRNGEVGATRDTETAGTIRSVLAVPDSLYTAGTHTLALRLSNTHAPRDLTFTLYGLAAGPYASFIRGPDRYLALPFIGGFLVMMVYTGILFFLNPEQRDVGILAAFCLVLALLTSFESLRDLVNYPYSWHASRLHAITALTSVLGLLLPGFVLVQFDVPRRRLALGGIAVALAAVLALPLTSDETVFSLYVVMLTGAIAAAGWALWKRRNGAALAFAGLLTGGIALVLTDDLFPARYFAPVFAAFATGLLGTLALRAHREASRRRSAELREARLELELVKRHLQPHFLKNTLTAAMEWIEADPERGVTFLGSVADLLSSINEASNQTLISVEQEIAMCRAYLHVMSGRTGQTYQFNTKNLATEARIPPALFLTLVENGVTHARRRPDATVVILLREATQGDRRRYELTVSPVQEPDGFTGNGADASARDGTGLRYVRSRLAEVTPEHSLRSAFTPPDAWQTDIELPLRLSCFDPRQDSSDP